MSLTTLRVLTYNVRSLRDSQTAAPIVVGRIAPDVALLQETPRFLRWRSRLAALARRSGLLYETGGRPLGGTALLAGLRVDVLTADAIPLSTRPRLHQRGLAAIVAEVAGQRVVIGSVHMSLDRRERLAHTAELLDHVAVLQRGYGAEHVVLGGDLNEPPDGPTWRALAAGGLHDAWAQAPGSSRGGENTFPAAMPERRIDAVLVSSGVQVAWAGVPDEVAAGEYAAASDHRPVLAELTL